MEVWRRRTNVVEKNQSWWFEVEEACEQRSAVARAAEACCGDGADGVREYMDGVAVAGTVAVAVAIKGMARGTAR